MNRHTSVRLISMDILNYFRTPTLANIKVMKFGWALTRPEDMVQAFGRFWGEI